MRNAFAYLFIGLNLFSLANAAKAEVRVGHDRQGIVVESSDFDCRIQGREEEFLAAADQFSRLMQELFLRFPGAWRDQDALREREIREHINQAIRSFYEQRIGERNALDRDAYGDPNFPRPIRMMTELSIPTGVLKPSAMWISIARRLIGNDLTPERARDVAAAVRSVSNPAALTSLNGGVTVQFGVVMTPMCQWAMEKDPERQVSTPRPRVTAPPINIDLERHLRPLRGESTEMPGSFRRGWTGLAYDFEPFVMLYVRGGLGSEIQSANPPWWQRYKLSIGMAWGDINQAADLAGGFFNGGLDLEFRLPWARIPERFRYWGMNWKGGCINNPNLAGIIPLPLCDDFLFVSWRPELRENFTDRDGGSPNWSLSASGKVEAGTILTGAPAIRLLMTLFNYSPEQVESTLESLDWIIDTPESIRLRNPQAPRANGLPTPPPPAPEPTPAPATTTEPGIAPESP